MKQFILVLNAGSSSLKFKLFNASTLEAVAEGQAERIGQDIGRVKVSGNGQVEDVTKVIPDHTVGLESVMELLYKVTQDEELNQHIMTVGHRIVHGGEFYNKPTVIDEEVKKHIKELFVLAPLHNPAHLIGIEVSEKLFPQAKQVAVFDTAFHQTMPEHAFRYAIPHKFYKEMGVRVYGMHGTSHKYVSDTALDYLGLKGKESKIITLHLGNGCSMSAVKDGKCIDTSMGLSPLAGLIMGSRSGDIDPSIFTFLSKHGYTPEQVDHILNKESGMIGLTGESDLRTICAAFNENDETAVLALLMYAYRIKKYIGAYTAAMNGLDALVFTAGVGENSWEVRRLVCEGMEYFGISIDIEKNDGGRFSEITELHTPEGKIPVIVVPTNEEYEIAQEAKALS